MGGNLLSILLVLALCAYVGSSFLLWYLHTHVNPKVSGWIGVVLSVLFFGTFAVPVKSPDVIAANTNAAVFQVYINVVVFVTSMMTPMIPPHEVVWDWHGVYGALLWVPANLLAIVAVQNIGLGVAMGTWAGLTVVVSFVWGAGLFHEAIEMWSWTIVGLGAICAGIAGLATTTELSSRDAQRRQQRGQHVDDTDTDGEDAVALIQHVDSKGQSAKKRVLGFAATVGVGLFNGSMMVPNRLATAQGAQYIFSFGVGCAMVGLLIVLVLYIYGGVKGAAPRWNVQSTALPGLLSGLMWTIGNYSSVYATEGLGLTIGFPLTQLALLVGGLWGIFYFREISAVKHIVSFFISAVVLLGGAALLSVFA